MELYEMKESEIVSLEKCLGLQDEKIQSLEQEMMLLQRQNEYYETEVSSKRSTFKANRALEERLVQQEQEIKRLLVLIHRK